MAISWALSFLKTCTVGRPLDVASLRLWRRRPGSTQRRTALPSPSAPPATRSPFNTRRRRTSFSRMRAPSSSASRRSSSDVRTTTQRHRPSSPFPTSPVTSSTRRISRSLYTSWNCGNVRIVAKNIIIVGSVSTRVGLGSLITRQVEI